MSLSIVFSAKAIHALDYIPIVSTGKSLIDLFIKYVVLPEKSDQEICENPYYAHLHDYSSMRLIVLLIPGIGNLSVALFDLWSSYYFSPERLLAGPYDRDLLSLSPLKTRDDKELALQLVSQDSDALAYLTPRLKTDCDVVKAALQKKGTAIRHLPLDSPLLNDSAILRAALDNADWPIVRITKEGIIFGSQKMRYELHFPEGFPNNRYQVLDWLTINTPSIGNLYANLSETLQKDEGIFSLSLQKGLKWEKLHPDLQNREFALKLEGEGMESLPRRAFDCPHLKRLKQILDAVSLCCQTSMYSKLSIESSLKAAFIEESENAAPNLDLNDLYDTLSGLPKSFIEDPRIRDSIDSVSVPAQTLPVFDHEDAQDLSGYDSDELVNSIEELALIIATLEKIENSEIAFTLSNLKLSILDLLSRDGQVKLEKLYNILTDFPPSLINDPEVMKAYKVLWLESVRKRIKSKKETSLSLALIREYKERLSDIFPEDQEIKKAIKELKESTSHKLRSSP